MTTELTFLGWTLVLAIVQILLPAMARNRETGIAYNAGARDDDGPPVGKVTARLMRAQRNLFETLPIYIAAVLIVHIAGRDNGMSVWGAGLYFVARVIYVPLYAAGVPYLRSLVWLLSLVGIGLLLLAMV